jgi:hypothetical protein
LDSDRFFELIPVVEALKNKDESKEGYQLLLEYFRKRKKPVFRFSPDDHPGPAIYISEKIRKSTIETADQICEDVFRFRNAEPVRFNNEIDWLYQPLGNQDWTWDLNRHSYFTFLGRAYWYTSDEKYALKFKDIVLDWIAKNNPDVNHPNWEGVFEVAYRINIWIEAFHYFIRSPSLDAGTVWCFLKSLLIHGRYLSENLEYHVATNHLFLEVKALSMLAIMFPEFKDSLAWEKIGFKNLFKQVIAQVCSDGVHVERSTTYHRIVAGELLELLVIMENNNQAVPADIYERFRKMVEYEINVLKPNGQFPLLNDSAQTDSYKRYCAGSYGPIFLGCLGYSNDHKHLEEDCIWLFGEKRIKAFCNLTESANVLQSTAFPEGGFYIMRGRDHDQEAYLVFTCGPFGFKTIATHGHADALSFELHAYGQTLLVDPGVYSYFLGNDWRNYFRSTRAHNTIVVDGQDQSMLLDTQRVYRPAQCTLHQWITSDILDYVNGSHSGYRRFKDKIIHCRQILYVKPKYWIIVDRLSGRKKHIFDQYFHLMPMAEPQLVPDNKMFIVNGKEMPGFSIIPMNYETLEADTICGEKNPIQGWVSFHSGEKLPAPVIRYRRTAKAPVRFITVLTTSPMGTQPDMRADFVPIQMHRTDERYLEEVVGLRITGEDFMDLILIDCTDGKKPWKRFDRYRTNAEILYVRQAGPEKSSIKACTVGGGKLLFNGTEMKSVCLDDSSSELPD